MKKIINGKSYNTETAEKIGEHVNGLYTNDFNYYCEELYKKKTGEFFIAGEGGARSKYASSDGTGRWYGYGTAIVPITEEEARQFAEDYLDYDDYVKTFGEVEE